MIRAFRIETAAAPARAARTRPPITTWLAWAARPASRLSRAVPPLASSWRLRRNIAAAVVMTAEGGSACVVGVSLTQTSMASRQSAAWPSTLAKCSSPRATWDGRLDLDHCFQRSGVSARGLHAGAAAARGGLSTGFDTNAAMPCESSQLVAADQLANQLVARCSPSMIPGCTGSRTNGFEPAPCRTVRTGRGIGRSIKRPRIARHGRPLRILGELAAAEWRRRSAAEDRIDLARRKMSAKGPGKGKSVDLARVARRKSRGSRLPGSASLLRARSGVRELRER